MSMAPFLRQEYCSGLPFPTAGDLSNSGIEPASPVFLHYRWILALLSHWGSVEIDIRVKMQHRRLYGNEYRISEIILGNRL